jgi:protein-S-isoprenylcysteine O-methyltransferase Ste14
MDKKLFFVQMVQRFLRKNPKFFQIIQYISVGVMALSFLIDFLQSSNINLPAWVSWLGDFSIKIGAITALLMGQLPNQDNPPKDVTDVQD